MALIPLVIVSCSAAFAIHSIAVQDNRIAADGIAQSSPGHGRLSVVSCQACHGSLSFVTTDDPAKRWKSAYQSWSSQDPHATAYNSLRSERSQKMVAALATEVNQGLANRLSLDINGNDYQGILNDRCVSCHSSVPPEISTQVLSSQGESSPQHLSMSTGVNCHSCHSNDSLNDPQGNAWVEAHTKSKWEDPGFDVSSSGFRELSNLDIRARTCVKCHVGSEDRDVNHDLIAAGHPRLVFEYSSHLDRLPKHWDEPEIDNFNMTCWSVGQNATTQTALGLLLIRAQAARDGSNTWPELSEYNCHNCHQGLDSNWYLANVDQDHGKALWGTWLFPGRSQDVDMMRVLDQLRTEMQQLNPTPVTVIKLTQDLARSSADFGVDPLYAYIQREPRLNSDELLGWYLASASWLRDQPVQSPQRADVEPALTQLYSILTQPFETDSNVNDQPKQKVDAAEIRKLMIEIRQVILDDLKTQPQLWPVENSFNDNPEGVGAALRSRLPANR